MLRHHLTESIDFDVQRSDEAHFAGSDDRDACDNWQAVVDIRPRRSRGRYLRPLPRGRGPEAAPSPACLNRTLIHHSTAYFVILFHSTRRLGEPGASKSRQ
jgi:hypothetical protein